ncbi:MAG: dual specificity protein phosphatase [Myxococcota bacterium]
MALVDRLLSRLGLDFEGLSLRNEPRSAITPELAVGARPLPEERGALRAEGTTHVCSCLEGHVFPKVGFLGRDFETLQLPLRDAMDEDVARFFPDFFAFAREAAQGGGRLLVHCEAGVSRSATLAIAQLMETGRLSFFTAFERVRAKRPGVLPNLGFASQLQRFERPQLGPPAAPSSLARYLREVCAAPVEVEVLDEVLARHDHDAPAALQAIFGEIPRVVLGARR